MLQVLNGPVIAAGESVSDGIDCTAGPLVRITFPAQWGGGNLTFLISSDGNGYNDIYDAKGEPVTAVVRPGGAVRVPLEWSSMLGWLKFRAGTPSHPVVQEARREFSVALEVAEPPALRR